MDIAARCLDTLYMEGETGGVRGQTETRDTVVNEEEAAQKATAGSF